MKNLVFITIMINLIALNRGAIEDTKPLSKLTSNVVIKQPSDTKDLTSSASDRSFLFGREYGYGNGGYGGAYGNYPSLGIGSVYSPTGSGYYNRNGLNSVYRGYQTGSSYGGTLGGGNTGWGYYGGYGSGGYGGLGGGYGGYEDGYPGLGGRGYNRWYNLDGYGGYLGNGYGGYPGSGYGGIIGSGYGGYGGSGYSALNYPYGYRGSGYGSYSGYSGNPSGYRGYS